MTAAGLQGDFESRVLAWVQERHRAEAEEVEGVTPRGTDWAGSTEQGFYSTFAVDVKYAWTDPTGALRHSYIAVEGEDMESLWKAAVADRPAD